MTKDSTKTIASATKRFFSGTLISRVSGLGREMVTASAFGCHPAIAAFWMAFRFSNLLRRLLGEGAMQSSFIPHFEEMRNKSPDNAMRFFRDLSLGIALILLVIVLLTEGILWGALNWGGVSSSNAEVIKLTIIMLPAIFFVCLAGINVAFLQCNNSYFTPAVAPVSFNIFWILSVLALKYWHVEHNVIAWFAVAVVIAYFVQWFFTIPGTLKYMRSDISGRFFSGIRWFSGDFLKFKGNLLISIVGVSAVQINSALDVIFARAADSIGPAYLNYALRLQQLPLGLFGIALAGALLPALSRSIKGGDIEEGKRFLLFALNRCFTLMVPCTLAIMLLSGASVNLIYGRGGFDQEATYYTSQCLCAYGIGLLPMTMVFLLASACYAQGNYRIPTIASAISMVLNIVLNSIFVFVIDMGAASVALATSISAFVNVGILIWFVFKRVMNLSVSSFLFAQWKLIFSCCLAWVIAEVVYFNGLDYPRELFAQLKYFALPATLFTVVLLFMAWVFGLDLLPKKNDNS